MVGHHFRSVVSRTAAAVSNLYHFLHYYCTITFNSARGVPRGILNIFVNLSTPEVDRDKRKISQARRFRTKINTHNNTSYLRDAMEYLPTCQNLLLSNVGLTASHNCRFLKNADVFICSRRRPYLVYSSAASAGRTLIGREEF
jgi:hypothetical protein